MSSCLTHTRQLGQVFKEKQESKRHLGSVAVNMGEGTFPFRAGVIGGGIFLPFDCKAKAEAGCRIFGWWMSLWNSTGDLRIPIRGEASS